MQKVIVKTEDAQSTELKMFHIHLDAAMLNARMDKQTVADAIGVSVKRIENWMNGTVEPNGIYLYKIADVVGIPYGFLSIP